MQGRHTLLRLLSLFCLITFAGAAHAQQFMEGKIYFGVRDLEDGGHENFIDFRESESGKVYSLGFKGSIVPEEIKKLHSGQNIRLSGKKLGGKDSSRLGYDSLDYSYVAPMEDVYSVGRVNGAGSRKALVVRVNLKDEGQLGCNSTADLEDRIFSESNPSSAVNVLDQMSAGQFEFTGRVVTVELDTATTDYMGCSNSSLIGLSDLANEKLLRMGINPKDYQYQQYYIPSGIDCSFGGWGWASANLSFVRTCSDKTPVHEFGHNFGLQHAASSSYEYGDYSDLMGLQYRELNAAHRDQLGWMNSQELKVVDATVKQTFRLYALNTNDDESALKAIKFARSGEKDHMYLAYRTATGVWDGQLLSDYAGKLNLHKSADRGLFQNYHNKTYFVKALTVGETYTDSSTGISVKVLSKTSSYMDISINGGEGTTPPPSCEEVAPTISISTSYLSIEKGKSKQRSFTVKNNNNSYCASKTYALSIGDISGINGSLNKASVSLVSGASATVYASASVSSTKATGYYQLPITAKSSSNASISASASLRVRVIEPVDTIAPSVALTTLKDGESFDEGVRLSVSLSASDNVAVTKVGLYIGSALQCEDTSAPYQCSFTVPTGGFVLTAKAFDAKGNVGSASVNLTGKEKIDMPPVIELMTPTSVTLKAGDTLKLKAKITDDNYDIRYVYFYTPHGWVKCQIGYNCAKEGDVYTMDILYSTPGAYRTNIVAYAGSFSNPGNSAPISVTVQEQKDLIAPKISFSYLTDGGSFYEGSRVSVALEANDNVAVTKTALYIGSTLQCEDTSAPYQCSFTVPQGDFTLTAKAYDAAGNVGSANVTLFGKEKVASAVVEMITPSAVSIAPNETLKLKAKITHEKYDVSYVYFYSEYGWRRCELGHNCSKEGDIYTMDLSYAKEGTYNVSIVAYAGGFANPGRSSTVEVTVEEKVQPTGPITFLSPSLADAYAPGEIVTVHVKVDQSLGPKWVYIWIDGRWKYAKKQSDGTYKYFFVMTSTSTKIRAMVYDSSYSRVLSDFHELNLK